MNYSEMNVQQRAEHLLAQGVGAKLGINPSDMTPGYTACVLGSGDLPCGWHETEAAAIDSGASWLHEKAKTPNVELTGRAAQPA